LRTIACATAIAAVALAACPPADAATARVDVVSASGATTLLLVYQADPGEKNAVSVGIEPDGWYRVHDPGATIAVGDRCEAASGGDARCFANEVEVRTGDMDDSVGGAAGAAVERISGGDGNDTLDVPAGDPRGGATVMGGDGNDVLRDGEADASLLEGDAGDDDIAAGADNDVVDGGAGSDRISGGEGFDTLANRRPDGVTIDLAQHVATASGGERDELAPDIENVAGGAGPDDLSGDDAANTIGGGLGDDAIRGAGGNDTLTGDQGRDAVSGDSGNDTLFAGHDYSGDPSANSLNGGTGRDSLVGGEGKDHLDGGSGGDWLLGQGGADVYDARDGEFDWVACQNRKRGVALLDVGDFVDRCGRVVRTGTARAIVVYSRLAASKYRVGLACPGDMPRPCEGTYRLAFHGGHTRAALWKLRPGGSTEGGDWETTLSTTEQRALRRAPAGSITLRLRTRDARGHRVTLRSPFPGPRVYNWPNDATGADCESCPPDP
jgi:Ca2+-binding RTX toxin-like protein